MTMTVLDVEHTTLGYDNEPAVRLTLVCHSANNRHYFSQLVQKKVFEDKGVRVAINDLNNMRLNAEVDRLESRIKNVFYRLRYYVDTGEDERTEFDPISLKLGTRTCNSLGWSEAEQEYV